MFKSERIKFKGFHPAALLVSIVLHAPLFLLYKFSGEKSPAQEQLETVELYEYPVHKQIISQQNFNKIKPNKPPTTSYLSKADKTVEKETQAMLKGLFYQAKIQKNLHQIKLNNPPLKKRELANTQLSHEIERKDTATEQDLLYKISKTPIQMKITDQGHTSKQELSRTMDFLPRIELGSHTLLNTREFAYYSYFSRMKEQLYWEWTRYFKTELPPASLRLVHLGAQQFFSTNVYVYLSPDGEVQDIQVVKSSGAKDIDSAALHAFLSAAPFPNPPEELVEEDGYIHIRQSFNLYISSSGFEDLFSKKN